MENVIYPLVDSLVLRWSLITFIIIINLGISLWEAVKYKNFDIKKLPHFAQEWAISLLVVTTIEVIVLSVPDSLLSDMFSVFKEVIMIAIIGSYLKKIFESIKAIGWSVNTDKISGFLDDIEDASYSQGRVAINKQMLEVGDMDINTLRYDGLVEEESIEEFELDKEIGVYDYDKEGV